jgi:hypothetical protein
MERRNFVPRLVFAVETPPVNRELSRDILQSQAPAVRAAWKSWEFGFVVYLARHEWFCKLRESFAELP